MGLLPVSILGLIIGLACIIAARVMETKTKTFRSDHHRLKEYQDEFFLGGVVIVIMGFVGVLYWAYLHYIYAIR